MTGSAGLSLSQSKVNSEYASVGDQSGLFAGNGGYDIYVGNHTQLNGAVIASTAQSADNALSTGTLGWSDIDNHASYKASSSSISMGGGNEDNKMSGGAIPTSANTHGSASGTTRSAVADGTITVRNGQAQTQNVADLSRDTDNANGHIDKIFDKDKVARKLEFAQGMQELGQRVAGDVSSYKMQAAEDETRERLLKANPQYAGYSTDALNTLIVNDPGYKAVAEKWGTGGSYSMAAAAVTGVLGGLGAGNLGAAAAGGMAPYIANKIKQATSKVVDGQEQTNVLANTMAHAVAGAVLAQLAGNNATAGAAGAAGGELMARAILSSMYPGKQASELTQDEKQVVSALGQLAAQLSAGVASGSVEGGIQGAVAGKNAVENNFLGATSSEKLDKAVEKIKQGDKSLAAANELIKLENADRRSDALVSKFTKDPSQMNSTERAELAGYLRVYASEMEQEYGSVVSQELVKGLLSGQDYIKRAPDSEAMSKAQSIMNTWGYHKSNASIGDAPMLFGGSVLGLTVKGMAANAAIGVGVNAGVQLAGKDPFSYVDVIMAGVTAAATTGKGIIVSTPVNVGGAVVGSVIKGEDPTSSAIAAGAGSIIGGVAGKVATEQLKPVIKEGSAEIIGTVTGGTVSEITGKNVQDALNNAGGKNGKN